MVGKFRGFVRLTRISTAEMTTRICTTISRKLRQNCDTATCQIELRSYSIKRDRFLAVSTGKLMFFPKQNLTQNRFWFLGSFLLTLMLAFAVPSVLFTCVSVNLELEVEREDFEEETFTSQSTRARRLRNNIWKASGRDFVITPSRLNFVEQSFVVSGHTLHNGLLAPIRC
ncbi:MAG: hypothetical protein ACI9HK_003556 [Pirellulaceae bacterium]|jgi:hypothetical protein